MLMYRVCSEGPRGFRSSPFAKLMLSGLRRLISGDVRLLSFFRSSSSSARSRFHLEASGSLLLSMGDSEEKRKDNCKPRYCYVG